MPGKKKLTVLEKTAYHEAGHAVASVFLFLPFRSVTIKPNKDSLGVVQYRKFSEHFWTAVEIKRTPAIVDKMERHIKSSLAGPIAEQRATGRKNKIGGYNDHQSAMVFATRL